MKYWLFYLLCIAVVMVGSVFAADRLFPEKNIPTLSVLIEGELTEITAEDFTLRILLAHQGQCDGEENLKALAVAARSCGVYTAFFGCKHDGFDLCDDENCCFALGDPFYADEDFLAKCIEATEETTGLCLTFENSPSLALFSLCNGSGSKGFEELSYILPVGEESLCDIHINEKSFDYDCLESLFDVGRDELLNNSTAVYGDYNKCEFLILGGKYFQAAEICDLLALESDEFVLSFDEKGVNAKVFGVGNGFGLSICGGNRLEEAGFSFEEILENYYPDLELNKIYNN